MKLYLIKNEIATISNKYLGKSLDMDLGGELYTLPFMSLDANLRLALNEQIAEKLYWRLTDRFELRELRRLTDRFELRELRRLTDRFELRELRKLMDEL